VPTSDCESWSVAHLKEYLEALIASHDKMYEQRHENDKNTLAFALESLDKRLNGMNEFRAALSDQATRMVPRDEYDERHNSLCEKMELGLDAVNEKLTDQLLVLENKTNHAVAPLAEKMEQIGRPNWTIITSFLSIAGISIAGLWLVIGLKIDNSNQPFSLEIGQLKANTASYVTSITDQKNNRDRQISDLQSAITRLSQDASANVQTLATIGALQQARIHTVDSLVEHVGAMESDLKTNSAVINSKLTEIETQLKSVSVVININKDDTNKMLGLLWKKVFNQELPSQTYRPDLYEK